MPLNLPRRLCCAALAGAAVSVAAAQGPDPLDPQASVPAVGHRSALADYRSLADSAPLSWREANDTVRRIGGWRTYLREAQPPAAPAAAALPTPPPAGQAPMRHPGHEHHPAPQGPARPGATR